MHTACMHGHQSTVQLLVADQRCQLNTKNNDFNTSIHIACYMKAFSIIRLLLERRCSTKVANKKGETAQDIPLNEDGDCLLHIACQWENAAIVSYLITDERCNPNVTNASGSTPLHIASNHGDLDIVKLLLERRCSTNVSNEKDETAQEIPFNEDGDYLLHVACQWGDVDMIRYLVTDQSCDPNVRNKRGLTPLLATISMVMHQ